MGGMIFVSCGQVTLEEKQLGGDVCALVRELTPHEPYFAENQSTLEALTRNILSSLDSAVGLIAIMHPRGTVIFADGTEHVRASVWIEQEIAMAAFITQILGRPLKIAPYIHADIRREGMREQLQLNAVSFKESSEVLGHLRTLLPAWNDLPNSLKILAPANISVAIERGLASDFLLKFTNHEDVEISILKVGLESKGIELIDPVIPDIQHPWKVPPRSSQTFPTQASPAARLVRMNEDKGIYFMTELDVSFSCSMGSGQCEIRKKLAIRVHVMNNQIVQI